MHTIQIDEEQRQLLIMALAHLAIQRPGFDTALRAIAKKIDEAGVDGRPRMYQRFKALAVDGRPMRY